MRMFQVERVGSHYWVAPLCELRNFIDQCIANGNGRCARCGEDARREGPYPSRESASQAGAARRLEGARL